MTIWLILGAIVYIVLILTLIRGKD